MKISLHFHAKIYPRLTARFKGWHGDKSRIFESSDNETTVFRELNWLKTWSVSIHYIKAPDFLASCSIELRKNVYYKNKFQTKYLYNIAIVFIAITGRLSNTSSNDVRARGIFCDPKKFYMTVAVGILYNDLKFIFLFLYFEKVRIQCDFFIIPYSSTYICYDSLFPVLQA